MTDINEVKEVYDECNEYLDELIKHSKRYLNDVESLKSTIQDFINKCEKTKSKNNELLETKKKYINTDNWSDPFDDLYGSHYLAYIKRYVHTFEGTSKIFRDKLNG